MTPLAPQSPAPAPVAPTPVPTPPDATAGPGGPDPAALVNPWDTRPVAEVIDGLERISAEAPISNRDGCLLLSAADRLRARSAAEVIAAEMTPSISSGDIARQAEWNARTFGPGARTAGVVDHLRKELDEVADNPGDVSEWADLVILAFDGATRAGHEPAEIIAAYHEKRAVNEARTWPDWRTAPADRAIEHDRSAEASTR